MTYQAAGQGAAIYFRSFITGLTVLLMAFSSSNSIGQEDHVGIITPENLLANYEVFRKEYDSYEPNQLQIDQIQHLANKEITALFGTWCHDSEREIPRLLKLLEAAGIGADNLTLYGVDRNKQDPDGYAEKYDLRYTPTIIVSDDQGKELGRIIEKPKNDIASDFSDQLTH